MNILTAVGIDVSKGKSTVAVMRPGGEVVVSPFDVPHSRTELNDLAKMLLLLDGEVRVVMEYTGVYYLPIAQTLCQAGLFVSVVHAKLVHDFGNNTIRRGKTNKKDALKIANYALANWDSLPVYREQDDIRQQLKTLNRQLSIYTKYETALKNNLIGLLKGTLLCLHDRCRKQVLAVLLWSGESRPACKASRGGKIGVPVCCLTQANNPIVVAGGEA